MSKTSLCYKRPSFQSSVIQEAEVIQENQPKIRQYEQSIPNKQRGAPTVRDLVVSQYENFMTFEDQLHSKTSSDMNIRRFDIENLKQMNLELLRMNESLQRQCQLFEGQLNQDVDENLQSEIAKFQEQLRIKEEQIIKTQSTIELQRQIIDQQRAFTQKLDGNEISRNNFTTSKQYV